MMPETFVLIVALLSAPGSDQVIGIEMETFQGEDNCMDAGRTMQRMAPAIQWACVPSN